MIKLSNQTLVRTGTKIEKYMVNSLPTKVVYPGEKTLPYKAGIRNIIVTKNFIDNKPYVSVEMASVKKNNPIETALGIKQAKTMLKDIFAQYKNKISKKG